MLHQDRQYSQDFSKICFRLKIWSVVLRPRRKPHWPISNCWQLRRLGKGVVFTTTLIALSGFYPHPSHVVASLDKTLYDDYLCLVASNQQQIQWTEIWRNSQEHWITGNSLAGADSFNHEVPVVIAMKSVQVFQYFASDAIRWQGVNMRYNNSSFDSTISRHFLSKHLAYTCPGKLTNDYVSWLNTETESLLVGIQPTTKLFFPLTSPSEENQQADAPSLYLAYWHGQSWFSKIATVVNKQNNQLVPAAIASPSHFRFSCTARVQFVQPLKLQDTKV